jgi:hypothetical protein
MSLTRDEYRDLTRNFLTEALSSDSKKSPANQRGKRKVISEASLMSAEEGLVIALDSYVNALESNIGMSDPDLIYRAVQDFIDGYWESLDEFNEADY